MCDASNAGMFGGGIRVLPAGRVCQSFSFSRVRIKSAAIAVVRKGVWKYVVSFRSKTVSEMR